MGVGVGVGVGWEWGGGGGGGGGGGRGSCISTTFSSVENFFWYQFVFVTLYAINHLSLTLALSPLVHPTQILEYGALKIGRSCLNPDHTPSNSSISLEVFGRGSRCFDQSEPFVRTNETGDAVTAESYGAGCYEVCTRAFAWLL